MRFRILGPLGVEGVDGEIALGGRTARTILALLLVEPGRIVPLDRIIEAVWEDAPPSTAKRQIQNAVAALRRLLPGTALRTDGPGYRIAPADGELDASVFTTQVARARELAGRRQAEAAVAEFRSALQLWRGPALFGLTGRILEAAAAGLDDQRLTAAEDCADLELALGRHERLIGELTALVGTNPFRERLVGHLMLALHRSGRQAEALRAYQRLRTALADELGVDPGDALQRTHLAILTNAPAPAVAEAPAEPGRCHLPRAIPDFVGRAAALRELTAAVAAEPGGPAILVIGGMAGIGKTTLAVHLGHALAGRYPDAQLYVDLHGHADRAPADPGAVLPVLLRQLGIAAHRVPEAVDDRVALWRAELARRRVVVLLDNAAGSRQVEPLLAAGPASVVIVTSRTVLAGIDGARAVSLPALSAAESAELLGRVVGARVTGAPEDAAELARLCGRLPLALRLAAARLVRRSTWSVADLNERLRDPPGRLSQLHAEDRAVAAAVDLSYRQLDDVSRRVFQALGAHPRAPFDRYAAASLSGLDPAEAGDRLEELVDAHLLETPAAGRYRLHDLLHDYAVTLLAAEPERQEAAVRRLLGHYVHTTAAATAHFERPVSRAALALDDPPPTVPPFADVPQAVAWLDAGWLTVVAAVELADARGADAYTWRLARALWAYVYRNGHNNELVDCLQRALRAANRLADVGAAATIHSCLAAGYANLKRYDATEQHLRECLAARRGLGDQRGVITALNNLALLHLHGAGRPHDAVVSCRQAMHLAERIGAEEDVYLCARTLGFAYRMLGRYDEALICFRRALAGFERTGQTSWQSLILGELGAVYAVLDDHETAIPLLRQALTMKESEGNRLGAAVVRSQLGEVYQAVGRDAEALDCHRDALAVFGADEHCRPEVLNAYGRTLLARGDRLEALAVHREALAAVEQSGDRYDLATAHSGIAAALQEHDPPAARRHWREALAIFGDMGVSEADEVHRRLARTDPDRGTPRRPG